MNRNNQLLKQSIAEYEHYLAMSNNINDTEFQIAAERCIERMRFIGKSTHTLEFNRSAFQLCPSNSILNIGERLCHLIEWPVRENNGF